MVCQNCGANNPDNALNCVQCGAPLMQAPPYGTQPPMAEDPAAMYPDGKTPGNGMGIAGMVLGIVCLTVCNCGIVPIIGLILSILGSKKDKEVGIANGKAKAGIIMNAIGLANFVLALIALFILIFAYPPLWNEILRTINHMF